MNTPDRSTHGADDADAPGGEDLGEQTRASPISIQKKVLAAGLAGAALAGSLLTAMVMIVTGHSHSREEISRLEKSIGILAEEKQVAQAQADRLRSLREVRLIAERRCEVIDGLDDCLAAGLKRPERFAESDRQFLEAGQRPQPRPPEQAAKATIATAARTATAESAPPKPAPQAQPAPRASGKMSLGEFSQELQKIPGVAVDSNVAEGPGRGTDDRKGKKVAGKPGS